MLHGSPGLADRFPMLFHFPAYTSGELAAIFTQRAHNAGGSGRSSSTPARCGNQTARLLVTAAACLAAGIIAFRLGERAAKARGSLARY